MGVHEVNSEFLKLVGLVLLYGLELVVAQVANLTEWSEKFSRGYSAVKKFFESNLGRKDCNLRRKVLG